MTKEEKILFNKVLDKGQYYINFPVMVIMFGCMGISYYLNQIEIISKQIMGVGFIISFVLGWLFWSIFIPKWRIWAFELIDEKFHYQLREEAVKGKLIWSNGHIFEKTEIRTKKQKIKIKVINDRIDELMNID